MLEGRSEKVMSQLAPRPNREQPRNLIASNGVVANKMTHSTSASYQATAKRTSDSASTISGKKSLQTDMPKGTSRPPSKKIKSSAVAESKTKPTSPSSVADGESYVNCRVCKFFETPPQLFFGTVTQFRPAESKDDEPLWRIVYDDDDSEDYTFKELVKRRKLYAKKCGLDPCPQGK
jgi:hypothetical protein